MKSWVVVERGKDGQVRRAGLELTAKEHLLKKNQESIEDAIRWGINLCEHSLSSVRDSLEVGAG